MKKSITRTKYKKREIRRAYAILVPFYLWFFIFIVIPLMGGFAFSFVEWNGLTASPTFVGLKNFKTFFTSSDYLVLLGRQFWLGGLCLTVNVILSFLVALILNIPFKGRGIFRSIFYIPAISSVATTSAVFVAITNPFDGGLNKFLKLVGQTPITWTYSAFWMTFWIVVYFVWRSIGPAAVIWLGGLQGISPGLYEAAKIDGANKVQEVRYITIPLLRPVATFIILTGIINVMQMYDIIMLISRGGPVGKTDVLMYRIFRDGIQSFNMGMGGASSVILGLVIMTLSVLYLKFFGKGEE